MKQLLLLCTFIIILLASLSVTAQVGIGTTEPQEMLHVAGENSTIRIDGLNSTNNPNNDGSGKVAVNVDADGNIVLERPVFDRFINELDILPATDFVGTQVKYESAYKSLYNYEVTTTDEAKLLFVGYQIGVYIREEDDPTKKLSKNHEAKLYGVAIVVTETPTVSLAQIATQGYASSARTFTSDNKYYDGKDFISGQALIPLEKNKTYYFHLVGFVQNTDDNDGLRAIYGGNGNLDRFQLFELN